VRPVVVTGAPQELIDAHLACLHVTGGADAHGLVLPSEDGRFLGTLDVNSGTEAGKVEILAGLDGTGDGTAGTGNDIVLAAGDSSSDRPLLEAARRQLIVGGGATDGSLEEFAATALAVDAPWSIDAGTMIERVEHLLQS
jgi:phosphoserine phosphatase